jgi:hypothetical protein
MSKKPNSADGRESYDSESTGGLIQFFNRNASPYPTEIGSPKFDLVPVTKQKDVMVNVARLHAKQEYNRIMELVEVLQRQASEIQTRLDLTDQVHGAIYEFQLTHGNIYWLLYDSKKNCTRLCIQGPNEWSVGKPNHYEYITRIKWLGDYTWIEIEDENTNE